MNPFRPVEPLAVRVNVACEMLGVGRTKLYQWIDRGLIRTAQIDDCRLVLVESLRELLANNEAA